MYTRSQIKYLCFARMNKNKSTEVFHENLRSWQTDTNRHTRSHNTCGLSRCKTVYCHSAKILFRFRPQREHKKSDFLGCDIFRNVTPFWRSAPPMRAMEVVESESTEPNALLLVVLSWRVDSDKKRTIKAAASANLLLPIHSSWPIRLHSISSEEEVWHEHQKPCLYISDSIMLQTVTRVFPKACIQ